MSIPTATATASPPAPPPLAERLDDFSDKLSPMLVKELRQGLRAKTFVVVFLALQALLTFVLLIASASTSSGEVVSSVIFFFFSLAVLVVQPLRGIGALQNEIRGNTIDLIVLTRMDTWRIVLGKWVSIVSQSGLLLAAIVPYLILRYFFGRMDLFAELFLLLLIFLGSAVFTAVIVGVSALPSIIVRGLLPLGIAIFLGGSVCWAVFDGELKKMIDFCSLTEPGSVWKVLTGIVTAVYGGWSALALGASVIAPMAENHSSIRRLVSLGAVILIGLVGWIAKFDAEDLGLLLLLFCAPAIAIAVTEPMNLLPPVTRPFLRFGATGKLAGRALYPGWASGVIFTGLLLLAAVAAYFLAQPSSNEQLKVTMIAAIGTLLFPAVVLRIFARKVKNPLAFYLLVLGITIAIAFALVIATIESETDAFVWFFSWIPPVQVILGNMVRKEHFEALVSGSTAPLPDFAPLIRTGIATAATCFAILLACAVKGLSYFSQVEDEASSKPETPA